MQYWALLSSGKQTGEEEVSEVPTLTDSELFIDSGYLSGLEAQSEITRLLDEIFGRLD